jgi:uncharacterized protein (TIGR01244 family)
VAANIRPDEENRMMGIPLARARLAFLAMLAVVPLGVVLLVGGCSMRSDTHAASADVPAPTSVDTSADWRRNLAVLTHAPRAGLYTAAQPAPEEWATFAKGGVKTVINLRTADELKGRDEGAEVRAAGMQYRSLPVDGIAGIRLDAARRLADEIAAAPGPVLLHCAASDRAGAMVALMASLRGEPAASALEAGRNAGMRRTEPRVRELLGVAPEVH